MTASPRQTSTKGKLTLIFFIMLMDIVGITLLSPVAPYIVQRYSDKAIMVSMITVLYAAGQFFAAPLMGKLGDRHGRRPVLLISLAGQVLGYLIFGLGGNLWILFLGRLIGGITGGNLSTATAYIADISKPEERAKNFALIGMAWSLGLILGPAMGGALSQVTLNTPAYVAAFFSLVNVVLGIFLLPESLPKEHRETAPIRFRDFNPVISILEMARTPGLSLILIVTSLFNFAFNGLNSTSSVFWIWKFQALPWQVSLLMMLSGAAIGLSNYLLVPRLVPRLGVKRAAVSSLLTQGFLVIGIFFVPLFWLVFPVNMLVSIMSSFTFPTLTTLATDCVPHRQVGLLMGVTTSIGSLMNILGPLCAGFAYDRFMPGSPFWLGGIILGLTGLLLLLYRSRSASNGAQEESPAGIG